MKLVVIEALDSLLRPEMKERVLAEALQLEGCSDIPSDPDRARAFIEGPLRLVLKRRVGPPMANLLMDALAPLFGRKPRRTASGELMVIGQEDDEVTVDTAVHDPRSLASLRARLKAESGA